MRQRWSEGSILRIGLKGTVTYCQMIRQHPFFAFFDAFGDADELDVIVTRPVLFKIAVSDGAFRSGRWTIIGRREPSEILREPLAFFRQDEFSKKLSIMNEYGGEALASHEDCAGLERAAVWDAEHVEDRLEDSLAGRPNKWVLSMSIKES